MPWDTTNGEAANEARRSELNNDPVLNVFNAIGCLGLFLVGNGCSDPPPPGSGAVQSVGIPLLEYGGGFLRLGGRAGAAVTDDIAEQIGTRGAGAAGGSAGAMRRLDYEEAPYHGRVDNAVKSRAPINGQEALDVSIQVKPTSPRRIGIDYDSKEFVVFDRTLNASFHGHVRSWKDLHPDMQRALQEAGMVDRKVNILVGGKR